MVAPMLLFSACFLWRASTLLTAVNLLALAGAVTIGALRRKKVGGPQSFNLARSIADRLLAEHRDELLALSD